MDRQNNITRYNSKTSNNSDNIYFQETVLSNATNFGLQINWFIGQILMMSQIQSLQNRSRASMLPQQKTRKTSSRFENVF